MTIRDERYPTDWPRISKRAIARAQNRCQECGLKGGILVRRKSRGRRKVLELVSDEEYVRLKKAASKREERQRQRLTQEQLDDHLFRVMFAEAVKDDPSWTVMVDPDERWGYYQEGDYYPYPDDDENDSEYTRAARELSGLGLTRIILQTHHIDENPSNCDDSNLLSLCQFCHGAKHGVIH